MHKDLNHVNPEQDIKRECRICHLEFENYVEYYAHRKEKHSPKKNKIVKSFTCQFCGRNFNTKFSHDNHVKIHTDQRGKSHLQGQFTPGIIKKLNWPDIFGM